MNAGIFTEAQSAVRFSFIRRLLLERDITLFRTEGDSGTACLNYATLSTAATGKGVFGEIFIRFDRVLTGVTGQAEIIAA